MSNIRTPDASLQGLKRTKKIKVGIEGPLGNSMQAGMMFPWL